MSDLAAISATRGAYRETADGSLEVKIIVDPRFKDDFHRIFKEKDMPIAIAPLNADFETNQQISDSDTDTNSHRSHQDCAGSTIDGVVVQDIIQEKIIDPSASSSFGHFAQALFKIGFFYNLNLLKALGTDAEFLAWLKTRPCAASHLGGCEGDVVAAHVRRVSSGAGMGIKPEYSAIPLCHKHHMLQHQSGESALGGPEWFDKARAKFIQAWAHERLLVALGVESLADASPAMVRDWAARFDLLAALPGVYREHAG